MGALFGLEGGLSPIATESDVRAKSAFPLIATASRARRHRRKSAHNEPRSQRPHAACWPAPPTVLGLIATLLADRDRMKATLCILTHPILSRACRAKQHSKANYGLLFFR